MSQRQIIELTCDRCGYIDQVPPERWGKIRRKPLGNVGDAYLVSDDLCPDCYRAFERFMKDGQNGMPSAPGRVTGIATSNSDFDAD